MRLIDADALRIVFTEKSSETMGGDCTRKRFLPSGREERMTLLEEFENLCKYIREVTGSDLVCGLCEYDAGTVGEEPIECPGFESNECFVLKDSVRKAYSNVEQVIRCKDCKWYEFDIKMHCGLPHGVRSKDDYCSDAERRKEND